MNIGMCEARMNIGIQMNTEMCAIYEAHMNIGIQMNTEML